MSFKSLVLRPEILSDVEKAGYKTPTPIKKKAIPLVIDGRDVMAGAQTGTGKTAVSRCRSCTALVKTASRVDRSVHLS